MHPQHQHPLWLGAQGVPGPQVAAQCSGGQLSATGRWETARPGPQPGRGQGHGQGRALQFQVKLQSLSFTEEGAQVAR